MKTWDFDNSTGGSKADFTKFPTGITKIRVLDSAPHIRWIHWMNNLKKSITCPGNGCPICNIRKKQKEAGEDYTYNMTRRFAMNILNRETGKIEIMEQGITFFQDLKDLAEELAEENKLLIDADLKVKRRGTGKDDTSYRIDIDEEYELSDNDKKLMEEMKDLEEYFKPTTPEQIQRLINGESWEDVMSSSEEVKEKEPEVQIK